MDLLSLLAKEGYENWATEKQAEIGAYLEANRESGV
jgi:hypothetical protein